MNYNYKNKLMFYNYIENVNKKFKNDNVRIQKQKFENLITQKRYRIEILLIIRRRKNELKQIHDQHMIFQKNNDDSYDTRFNENCCVYYKNEIEFDYIDD